MEVRKHIQKIELSLSESNGCPAQQKLYFPGNDYRLVTYTGLKYNPKLKDSDLELPKGARREKVN